MSNRAAYDIVVSEVELMKKIFPILLALLLLCGCALLPKQKTELVTDSATPEAFSSLVIVADVADVTLQYGADWRVDYALPVQPEITLEGGTLTIQDMSREVSIQNASPAIRVTVPQGTQLESAQITVDVGSVKAEALKITALAVKTAVGEVDLEDLVTTGVSAETDVGNVELERVTADSITVTTDTGDIELELPGAETDYTLELASGVGDVEVGGRDQGTKYSAPGGAKTVTATADVGEIEVEFGA